MRSWIALAVLLGPALSGCGPQSPEQARIDNIEDAAEAEADVIESASKNQIGQIRAEADTLAQQAEIANGFDAERMRARAEALGKDAEIVERHAKAQVQAVRDRARADVSAIKAQ